MMDGSCYECVGPCAGEVRKDVLNHINIVQVGVDLYKKEKDKIIQDVIMEVIPCLLYTSPSPRDLSTSRMPSSA